MVSVAYFDTSALLKRYVREAGSVWLETFLSDNTGVQVITSRLTIVETACAFARRSREGILTAKALETLEAAFGYDCSYRYGLMDVTSEALEAASRLASRYPLRAYDAVHLATAWLANQELQQMGQPPLVFVCADDRLLSMAAAEGLSTENPNHHP